MLLLYLASEPLIGLQQALQHLYATGLQQGW